MYLLLFLFVTSSFGFQGSYQGLNEDYTPITKLFNCDTAYDCVYDASLTVGVTYIHFQIKMEKSETCPEKEYGDFIKDDKYFAGYESDTWFKCNQYKDCATRLCRTHKIRGDHPWASNENITGIVFVLANETRIPNIYDTISYLSSSKRVPIMPIIISVTAIIIIIMVVIVIAYGYRCCGIISAEREESQV